MTVVGLVTVATVAVLTLALLAILARRLARPSQPTAAQVVRGVGRLARELESLFAVLAREVKAGVTTAQLERRVERLLETRGLRGYLKGYAGFPALIVAAVNDEVTNTVPSARTLAEGDLLKVQVGVSDGAFYALQGWTFPVGAPRPEDAPLLAGARAALGAAVALATPSHSCAHLTAAIHGALTERGLRPSREVAGHQVGLVPRKGPSIPCAHGAGGESSTPLAEGMVLHLVVVAHAGRPEVVVADDGWNVVAADGGRSATYSHLVAVGASAPERLTADHG